MVLAEITAGTAAITSATSAQRAIRPARFSIGRATIGVATRAHMDHQSTADSPEGRLVSHVITDKNGERELGQLGEQLNYSRAFPVDLTRRRIPHFVTSDHIHLRTASSEDLPDNCTCPSNCTQRDVTVVDSKAQSLIFQPDFECFRKPFIESMSGDPDQPPLLRQGGASTPSDPCSPSK